MTKHGGGPVEGKPKDGEIRKFKSVTKRRLSTLFSQNINYEI